MADKNTKNDNQKSKKKHKWIGAFLIALLLLFIGLAGYYLERDLEPVPDSQIEDSEVLDGNFDSMEEETAMNGEDGETADSEKSETKRTEEEAGIEEETTSSDMGENDRESEQPAVDQSTEAKLDEDQMAAESEMAEPDAEEDEVEEELDEAEEGIDEVGQKDESDDSFVEDEDLDSTTDTEISSIENSESSMDNDSSDVEEGSKKVAESEKTADAELKQESDIDQEREDAVEDDSSPLNSQVDSEGQVESESQDDFSQELEDPSLIDRILSILGLSDNNFSQDLNILFVGLDDEESVALGTIEADSIMLAKLRPEMDKLQLEHIYEDTIYKGQLLRDYHNGDIQLAVEEITESEIDYYVYVNYQGFEKVIDELGGVKITLDQEAKVPGLGLNLKAGDNLLSGKEALNFVRWRESDSLARFERQKLLINSVMSKLKSNNILFNVKDLYSTIVESYNSIETDINPVLAAEIFNYLRENDEMELEFIE